VLVIAVSIISCPSVGETKVVNMDQSWIYRKKIQLEALAAVTMTILRKWLAERR
jgi:hypothetical protein